MKHHSKGKTASHLKKAEHHLEKAHHHQSKAVEAHKHEMAGGRKSNVKERKERKAHHSKHA